MGENSYFSDMLVIENLIESKPWFSTAALQTGLHLCRHIKDCLCLTSWKFTYTCMSDQVCRFEIQNVGLYF